MDGEPRSAWRSAVPLAIGEFFVDPAANELCRDNASVRVRPLLMDVLLRLAATPGDVVTREQLIADVWLRRMVNDEVLSRAIAELRTALGDDAKQPRYIETLPKVGYRLIAAVATSAPVKAPARPRRWAAFAVVAIAASLLGLVGWMLLSGPSPEERLAKQLGHAESFAADEEGEFGPRFSPDGSQVVYAQVRGRESTLLLRDIAGNVVVRIAKPGTLMLAPVFHPDGKRIAFWRRNENAAASSSATSRQVPSARSSAARVPRARLPTSRPTASGSPFRSARVRSIRSGSRASASPTESSRC
jgi:DNA-binding winged helix-turn-helix (wHTH) protein